MSETTYQTTRAWSSSSPFVTVLKIPTVTLVPLQASTPVGGSKVHDEPHWTVLLVAHVRVGGVVVAA